MNIEHSETSKKYDIALQQTQTNQGRKKTYSGHKKIT
jgi:hypothetical protein